MCVFLHFTRKGEGLFSGSTCLDLKGFLAILNLEFTVTWGLLQSLLELGRWDKDPLN